MNTRGRVDVAGFRARPKGLWGTVRLLRIPILTAAAFGFLIAVPLAIWIGLLNEIESLLEFVALAAWLVPLYTVMGAVVLVGMCVLLLILGIQPTPRICIALSLSWYVFLNGIIRYITSVQFASVVPHLSLIGVVDGIAVVTATVSIGWGVARCGRYALDGGRDGNRVVLWIPAARIPAGLGCRLGSSRCLDWRDDLHYRRQWDNFLPVLQ